MVGAKWLVQKCIGFSKGPQHRESLNLKSTAEAFKNGAKTAQKRCKNGADIQKTTRFSICVPFLDLQLPIWG